MADLPEALVIVRDTDEEPDGGGWIVDCDCEGPLSYSLEPHQPLYTADQLRDYAAAKVAEERAKWVAEAAAFEQTVSRISQTIDLISANVDAAIRGTEAHNDRIQPRR